MDPGMKLCVNWVCGLALGVALSAAGARAQQMPRMTGVDPDNGKSGDVLTVSGENLDKSQVKELYLTDGRKDTKVEMTEQAATSIKFRIPAAAPQGRFALMVLTAGKEPKLIEEPVKVTIQ